MQNWRFDPHSNAGSDKKRKSVKVLIVGGTGFAGPLVVQQLCDRGCEVTVFHRGRTTAALPSGVKSILGDRHNLADHAVELKKQSPDIVLDMIPITEHDAQVLMNVFEGCACRVVAISSQDVYRAYGVMNGFEKDGIQKVPLNEKSPLRQKIYPYRGNQMRTDSDPAKWMDYYDKILVEKTVMGKPRLPGSILRLPMVYGPGDRQHRLYQYIKRMDDKRPAIILDDGLAAWRWTRGYVENIADAIVMAVTDEKATGRIYNVGEPDALTMAEWVGSIAGIAGWDGKLLISPKTDLPGSMVADFNTGQHLVTDSGLIRKELGYRERVTRHDALVKTVRWERENPPANVSLDMFDYEAEDKFLKARGL